MTICEKRFAIIEQKMVDDQTITNNKIKEFNETLNEDIEVLKKNEVRLSDDVTNLEAEYSQVTNKINLIDDAMKSNEDVEMKESDLELTTTKDTVKTVTRIVPFSIQ